MTLPMDISTALWWRFVPVWTWEALPPAPPATVPVPPEGDAPPPACPPRDAPAAGGGAASTPAPQPGTERDGYRLVFKGYEISASVFWYPADSALSRPWLRHDDPAADHRPRTDDDAAAMRATALQRAAAALGRTEPT